MDNKSNTTKRKKTLLVVTIFIIGAILCMAGGVIGLSQFTNSLPKENEISIDSPKAITAFESFREIYISPTDLYSKKTYDIKEISKHDLVASALNLLDDSFITFCPKEPLTNDISLALINNILSLYITDHTIDVDMIKKVGTPYVNTLADTMILDYGIKFIDDNILRIAGPCDTAVTNDFEKIKKIKATETDEYIYIYAKIAFGHYTMENNSPLTINIKYYNDYAKDGKVLEMHKINHTDVKSVEPNWDLYNTYQFKFKKGANSYYFEQLQLVAN